MVIHSIFVEQAMLALAVMKKYINPQTKSQTFSAIVYNLRQKQIYNTMSSSVL